MCLSLQNCVGRKNRQKNIGTARSQSQHPPRTLFLARLLGETPQTRKHASVAQTRTLAELDDDRRMQRL